MPLFKTQGNEAFQKGDFSTAIDLYKQSNDRPTVLSNQCLCHLKLHQYEEAIQCADEVLLNFDQNHPKALYRKALAQFELSRFIDCTKTLSSMLQIYPHDPDALRLLRRVAQTQPSSPTPDEALDDLKQYVTQPDKCFEEAKLEKAISSISLMNMYITRTGKPDVLRNAGAIPIVWKALKYQWENTEDPRSMFIDCHCLTLQMHLWRFCLLMALETCAKNADDEEQSQVDHARRLDKPLSVDADTTQRRIELSEAVDDQIFRAWLTKLIGTGVSELEDGGEDNLMKAKCLRRDCVVLMMDLIHYIGSFDRPQLLECLADGLDCVECRLVQHKALMSLTFLCDVKRRLGLKTTAVKVSHGLMRCLQSLSGLLELDEDFSIDAFAPETRVKLMDKEAKNDVISRQVHFALAAIFTLLADKERSADDAVNWTNLLNSLLSSRLDSSNQTEQFIGFALLNVLALADRQEVFQFSLFRYLPMVALRFAVDLTLEEKRLQRASAEYLIMALEFPELRSQVLDSDGLDILFDIFSTNKSVQDIEFRCTMTTVLARLSLHRDDIKDLTFDKLDFFSLSDSLFRQIDLPALQAAMEKGKEQLKTSAVGRRCCQAVINLLQILFFLSLHGDFKRGLLNLPSLTDLPIADPLPVAENETPEQRMKREQTDKENAEKRKIALQQEDKKLSDVSVTPSPLFEALGTLGKCTVLLAGGEGRFLFAGICQNLVRAHDDKDRLKKTKNAPDFDQGQMLQLQQLYEQLPDQAKPQESAHFHRGGKNLAFLVRKEVLRSNAIVPTLRQICASRTPPATSHLLKLCALSVRHLTCDHPELRADCFRQGGFAIVRAAVEGFKQTNLDEVRDFRQTIAHFAISVPPTSFQYQDLMGMATDMLNTLDDDYELFVYEAALGLTNLLSASDDVRRRVWNGGLGWEKLREVAIADNEMLRAAGLEMLCNLVASEEMLSNIANSIKQSGKFEYELALLLAFCTNKDNSRAWQAATGCVAMLAQDFRIALAIAKHSKFENIINGLDAAIVEKADAVQFRLITTLTLVWQALQWVVEGNAEKLEPSRFLVDRKEVEELVKRLYVVFGMFDERLRHGDERARQYMKQNVNMYPACPMNVDLHDLPAAVARFWADKNYPMRNVL